MDDFTLTLIQAGSMVSTIIFIFSRGLETRSDDLWYLGTRKGLFFKSFLSVVVIVPLIAIAIIVLVRPSKATAIGLILLAASPVAPMVLKKILQAGGDRKYAIGLHFVLAWLVIVTTPVTIELLFSMAGVHLDVDPVAVAGLVGLSFLLPISAGMMTGRFFPVFSRQIIRPLESSSEAVSILVNILVLLSTYQLLLMLDFVSYIAIALMVILSICAGHLMAWGRPEEQTTLALESGSRNVDLTLLIASTFTMLEKALPVIIPYIIISTIISSIYVKYRKRALSQDDVEGPVQQGQ